MTFREKYRDEKDWHVKVTLMELYHLNMQNKHGKWSLHDTASYFGVSVALASENLKLAKAMHTDTTIQECPSRHKALRKINGTPARRVGDNPTENQ